MSNIKIKAATIEFFKEVQSYYGSREIKWTGYTKSTNALVTFHIKGKDPKINITDKDGLIETIDISTDIAEKLISAYNVEYLDVAVFKKKDIIESNVEALRKTA